MKKFLKWFGIICAILALCVLSIGTFYVHKETKNLPTISKRTLSSDASSNMYASNGTLIWSSAINKRDYVKYKDLPQSYIDCLLSTEDRTFFQDSALSPKGIANAGLSVVREKLHLGASRGGSTIEQQLIKLSVFSTSTKDRTINRKIKEAFLAQQLEHNYSKQQILEMYVNKIYLGEGSYGAQTIAKTYYGKPLKDLNLSQVAIIAGLGQAGSYYNLYDRPKVVRVRRNQVLAAALANNKITKAQYKQAKATPITYGLKKRYWQGQKLKPIEEKHASFINATLNELTNTGYDLSKTPLQIHTSLNLNMDDTVRNTFDNHSEFFQNKRQQAAITITNPQNGHVLAQSGGRFNNSVVGFNRATSNGRSTGSAIKPINDYGPALEYLGWSTDHILSSSPYHYAGTNITATNFGGASYGNVTMQRAITESMNTPAIRTLDAVGPIRAKKFAGNLGITQSEPIAGSYALGMNTSTAKLAAAYGAFANGGTYKKPEYINYLIFPDFSRKDLQDKGKRAMEEATAYIMSSMLKNVITDKAGTLHAGEIKGLKMAAKTGTVAYPSGAHVPNDAAMDFWTVGYTTNLVISMWEGYDNPMAPNSYLNDNEAIIKRGKMWKYLVPKLVKGRPNKDFIRPKGVIGSGNSMRVEHTVQVKSLSNLVPSEVAKSVEQVADVDKLKKNKQSQYNVPKGWKPDQWKKAFDKTRKKAEKEDNNAYTQTPHQDY